MNIETVLILSFTSYKIISLLSGIVFGLLGYKLFTKGIYNKVGDLDTSVSDNFKLTLKNAAPGTFFAVIGAIIVLFTIIEGMEFYWEYGNKLISNKPELP